MGDQPDPIPESVRAWYYRVSIPVQALLLGYGVMADNKLALWVGLANAIFAPSLAAANTSVTKKTPK